MSAQADRDGDQRGHAVLSRGDLPPAGLFAFTELGFVLVLRALLFLCGPIQSVPREYTSLDTSVAYTKNSFYGVAAAAAAAAAAFNITTQPRKPCDGMAMLQRYLRCSYLP